MVYTMEMRVPGYWMNETSGELARVVRHYLADDDLSHDDLILMRAYLRQWIQADFRGPQIARLRELVEQIETTADVRGWLADALNAGIDPL